MLESGEARLDILIENGKIEELAPSLLVNGHETYDAGGCYIFPGFIDAHTHLDMDTGTAVTADNFKTGTLAALCGGTTSIIDFATQENGGSLGGALKAWHKKADGVSSCNYGFHMAITHVNAQVLDEIDDMFKSGVSSFKVYMAYDALRLSDREIFEVLLRVKKNGGILGAHCENGDLVNALIARFRESGCLTPEYHPLSRPPYLEAEAVTRFCAIGRAADAPVHIVHVSSAEALAAVMSAREKGAEVIAETCPQYFTLFDDNYARGGFEGAKYVCSPPLRKPADGAKIWSALLNGDIQTISTDHCSFNFKGQKELGIADFSKIPNGLAGIEHRPIIVLSRFINEKKPLKRASEILSANAARLFGLYETKGSIHKGKDADLTIFDPRGETQIKASAMHQNADYTPYEGFKMRGAIKAVFLNGCLCAENGEPLHQGGGSYLHRGKSRV